MKIIGPMAIDLGAENTGVYFAHYPASSTIETNRDGNVMMKYTVSKSRKL